MEDRRRGREKHNTRADAPVEVLDCGETCANIDGTVANVDGAISGLAGEDTTTFISGPKERRTGDVWRGKERLEG
jgi:hypothetical protein